MTEKRNLLTQSRDYYKPFVYPWAYEAFMQSEQMHWLWTEVPMVEDVKDWKIRLNDNERDFLTKVFRYFTQGDIDVSSAYVHTYLPAFPQPEIRMMLSSFAAREAVHIAAYSHLIETIGMPDAIYNEFLQYEAMAAKHEFFHGLRLNENENIAAKMAAFSAFTEGMQLFSSFVMLLNFTRNGTMRGMGQIIAWSINDETLHTESMIKLFREYIEQNPQLWNDDLKATIYSIAEKMVELAVGKKSGKTESYVLGEIRSNYVSGIYYYGDFDLENMTMKFIRINITEEMLKEYKENGTVSSHGISVEDFDPYRYSEYVDEIIRNAL